jgi:hypothetical protein
MQWRRCHVSPLSFLLIGLVSLYLAGLSPAQPIRQQRDQTVTIRTARSHTNPQTAPALPGVALLTNEEAHQLQLTNQEWLLPTAMPSPGQGPHVIVQKPQVLAASETPTLTATSPTDLLVVFEPNRAPVNMNSLEVQARKGIIKISLTDRLKPYIQGTTIQAPNLQIPSGKFLIEIDIADVQGERTLRKYYLQVSKK